MYNLIDELLLELSFVICQVNAFVKEAKGLKLVTEESVKPLQEKHEELKLDLDDIIDVIGQCRQVGLFCCFLVVCCSQKEGELLGYWHHALPFKNYGTRQNLVENFYKTFITFLKLIFF